MRLTLLALFAAANLLAQEPARFHHIHLNSVDPEAAIDFYTAKFKAERRALAGFGNAVWTGDSWLLFTKVAAAPPSQTVSGIWHFGWGAEDMKATYQKQVDSGTRFHTPLTDISDLVGGEENSGRFFYSYVDGPDHALIELNTARHHNFGHLHLYSANPAAAAEWYRVNLNLKPRVQAEPKTYRGIPVAPAAFMTANHVSIIVYPNPAKLQPSRGRVVDHVGFGVKNLDDAVKLARANGTTVTAKPAIRNGLRSAFLEGPDQVAIELLELPD